jgi:hypothetical protein
VQQAGPADRDPIGQAEALGRRGGDLGDLGRVTERVGRGGTFLAGSAVAVAGLVLVVTKKLGRPDRAAVVER